MQFDAKYISFFLRLFSHCESVDGLLVVGVI